MAAHPSRPIGLCRPSAQVSTQPGALQLGYVVAVAAGECPGERDPGRVDQEVVLGARSGSINRARARFGAPFFACTWLESATARAHSILPAARRSASSC